MRASIRLRLTNPQSSVSWAGWFDYSLALDEALFIDEGDYWA